MLARLAEAPVGSRLPSTRAIAAEFSASPVTVQRALRLLESRGRVEVRPGDGTFVLGQPAARPTDRSWQTASLPVPAAVLDPTPAALAEAPGDAIALHAGYPSGDLLPERLVRTALVRAARGRAALVRSSVAGDPGLRDWFAAELRRTAGAGSATPSAHDVMITAGSQAGLHAVIAAVAPGSPVVVESPTYWGALLALHSVGARVIPVPSGPSGPDPADVERAILSSGARVFYAQPTFANPSGVSWSASTRERVLQIVRQHGAFLLEDDWAHDFGIDAAARPLAATDDSGHIVYLRSLTKVVSPAIRVAAVVARGPVRDRILARLSAEAMYVSPLLQAAALDVVTSPGWQVHLRALPRLLRARRDQLIVSVRAGAPSAHITSVPGGGLNLWIQLPDGVSASAVTASARAGGLLLADGASWFPSEQPGQFLRLNYADSATDRYDEAARILAAAIEDARPTS
ncbi:MAG: PLP-dependent aminotransferase family protein [Naasia sp.]|nr:PLP-dependent aminotransferase family protein [Naasia sp.]